MSDTAKAKVLVFSTEKISDPAIDLAGLLKKHYPATVYTVNVPCSSSIKPKWILHALDKGFDGVFIAADGTDCPYGETCSDKTAAIVAETHQKMKDLNILSKKLKMAAICSICADPFVKHVSKFIEDLNAENNK